VSATTDTLDIFYVRNVNDKLTRFILKYQVAMDRAIQVRKNVNRYFANLLYEKRLKSLKV